MKFNYALKNFKIFQVQNFNDIFDFSKKND